VVEYISLYNTLYLQDLLQHFSSLSGILVVALYIGEHPDGSKFTLDSDELVNHTLVLGATGSGKTVLCKAIVEELALQGYPIVAIDPKGDVGCLAIRSKNLDFRPWSDMEAFSLGIDPEEYSKILRSKYIEELKRWSVDFRKVERFHEDVKVVIYTPRSNYGISLSIKPSLSPIPRVRDLMERDPSIVLETLNSTVATLLRLIGYSERDLKEHTLLAEILRHSWLEGRSMSIEELIEEVIKPSFDNVGKLSVDEFLPLSKRSELARSLNILITHPAYQAWLMGESIDFDRYFYERGRISIIDLRFMNDLREKQLFLAVFLQELYKWILKGGGTSKLRFLLYIDEVMGFVPPVQKPPSKTLLMLLVKQGRAFGLGVLMATQNPADVDYRVLSNASHRFIGRLSSRRDLENIRIGLELEKEIMKKIPNLKPRHFIYHNYRENVTKSLRVRWLLTYHRGPLKPEEIELLSRRFKKSSMLRLKSSKFSRKRDRVRQILTVKHKLNIDEISTFFKQHGYDIKDIIVKGFIYPAYRIRVTYRIDIPGLDKVSRTLERTIYVDGKRIRDLEPDLVPVDELPTLEVGGRDISIEDLQKMYTTNAYFSNIVKRVVLEDELTELREDVKRAVKERIIYELNKALSEFKVKEQELKEKIATIEDRIRELKDEYDKLGNYIKKLTNKKVKMRRKRLSIKKLSSEIRRLKMRYRRIEGELLTNKEILKTLRKDLKNLKKNIKKRCKFIESKYESKNLIVKFKVVPLITVLEKFDFIRVIYRVKLMQRNHRYEVIVDPHNAIISYGRCVICKSSVVKGYRNHTPPICKICGGIVCEKHTFTCYKCNSILCKKHAIKCRNIGAHSCPEHITWRGLFRKRAYCQ